MGRDCNTKLPRAACMEQRSRGYSWPEQAFWIAA